jgi:hypothetical protein
MNEIIIKRLDIDLFKSSHLIFRDEGLIKPGAKTRRYNVFDKTNRSLLGFIKWFPNWRQYCFFPLNSLFNCECLREVALFCEEVTTAHKSRLPGLKKREKEQKLARRQKRIEKLKKKKLTKDKSLDIIESKEVERQIEPVLTENQLVEGCQADFDAPEYTQGSYRV